MVSTLQPALALPRPTRCIAPRRKDQVRRLTRDLRRCVHAQTAGRAPPGRRPLARPPSFYGGDVPMKVLDILWRETNMGQHVRGLTRATASVLSGLFPAEPPSRQTTTACVAEPAVVG